MPPFVSTWRIGCVNIATMPSPSHRRTARHHQDPSPLPLRVLLAFGALVSVQFVLLVGLGLSLLVAQYHVLSGVLLGPWPQLMRQCGAFMVLLDAAVVFTQGGLFSLCGYERVEDGHLFKSRTMRCAGLVVVVHVVCLLHYVVAMIGGLVATVRGEDEVVPFVTWYFAASLALVAYGCVSSLGWLVYLVRSCWRTTRTGERQRLSQRSASSSRRRYTPAHGVPLTSLRGHHDVTSGTVRA